MVVLKPPQPYQHSGEDVFMCVYAKTIESALNCSLYNWCRHGSCRESPLSFLLRPVPLDSSLVLYPDFRSEPIYDDRYFSACGIDASYFWDNEIFKEELERELINRDVLSDFSRVLVDHPEWDDGNDYYVPTTCPFFRTKGPAFLIKQHGSAFKINCVNAL